MYLALIEMKKLIEVGQEDGQMFLNIGFCRTGQPTDWDGRDWSDREKSCEAVSAVAIVCELLYLWFGYAMGACKQIHLGKSMLCPNQFVPIKIASRFFPGCFLGELHGIDSPFVGFEFSCG